MADVIEKEPTVQIPEDVTVEILRRLPVKSLLRFGCACKTWYSDISDPVFCNKLHHKRDSLLIFETHSTFVTIKSLVKNEETPIGSIHLFLPPEPEHRLGCKLLGSCNGLVCFSFVKYRSPEGAIGLSFWNPSTRKLKVLPYPTRVRKWCDQNTCCGFCYDESVYDYKFVWMVIKPRMIEFDVFSLKSNTWSSFDRTASLEIAIPGVSRYEQDLTGFLSNGAVHWVVHLTDESSSSYRILAFDLTSNNYRLLETPPLGFRKIGLSLSGCLRLCIHYKDADDCVHLWMMKEYGVNSSWLKLVSFPTKQFILPTTISLSFYPILFSNEEGNIVAVLEHFSRECGEVREIMRLQVVRGAVVSCETLSSVSTDDGIRVWEESLVSLN